MAAASHRLPELACVPGAIPAADRAAHFVLAHKLFFELAEERKDLPDGYAFRFGPDALESLARFVANERKCCPFITFELSITADSGPIWLRMTGPDGTRAVLQTQLNLPGSCGCGNGDAQ